MEDCKIKNSENLSFSFDEILAKLEECRPTNPRNMTFTNEQDRVILIARDSARPVSWDNVCKIFAFAGWGKIHKSVFKRRYDELKEQGKIATMPIYLD